MRRTSEPRVAFYKAPCVEQAKAVTFEASCAAASHVTVMKSKIGSIVFTVVSVELTSPVIGNQSS